MNIMFFALSYRSGVPQAPLDGYPLELLVFCGVICFLAGYLKGRP